MLLGGETTKTVAERIAHAAFVLPGTLGPEDPSGVLQRYDYRADPPPVYNPNRAMTVGTLSGVDRKMAGSRIFPARCNGTGREGLIAHFVVDGGSHPASLIQLRVLDF